MNGNCYSSDGINPTLTCNKNEGNRVAVPVDCIDSWNRPIEGGYQTYREETPTLRSRDYKDPLRVAIPVLTPDRANKRQNGRRFKEDGEEAFSLTTQDRHGVAVNVTGYNATLKRGGGVTQTALALCARDGSGLSGSHQMMTAAAYLLSTKESNQKSEQKPTASPPEKTEDSADTNRKEP